MQHTDAEKAQLYMGSSWYLHKKFMFTCWSSFSQTEETWSFKPWYLVYGIGSIFEDTQA
jgi:hypothetical protein